MTLILPGLPADTDQFERVAAAMGEHAADLPALTWRRWSDPGAWCLVPDPAGAAYKAETILARTVSARSGPPSGSPRTCAATGDRGPTPTPGTGSPP